MKSIGVVRSLARGLSSNRSNQTTPTNGSLQQGPHEAVETATRVLPQWIPSWSIKVALALLVLLIGWYGSKLLVRILGRRVSRRFRRPSVSRAVLRSIRIVVIFFAVLTATAFLGVGFGNILLSVTVLTAAVGIVLAPILGGIISGLFVLSDQSYEIGDMVELVNTTSGTGTTNSTTGGTRGFVEDVTFQNTKIFTTDNTYIVIPNSAIRDRDVINYSAEDSRTRLSLDILVPYEGDLAQARDLIERAAREVDTIIRGGPDIRIGSARYPAAPTCYINQYATNGVLLTLRYWVKEPYKPLTVRSRVQENVWDAFDEADITFPYPHTHVVFDEPNGDSSVRRSGHRSADPGQHDE